MRWRTANRRRRMTERGAAWAAWVRTFKIGRVFHACNLHPCRITKLGYGAVWGVSLLTGSETSCSLSSCGPYVMTKPDVARHREAWERDGERGLLTLYYGSEAAADAFIEQWRTPGG